MEKKQNKFVLAIIVIAIIINLITVIITAFKYVSVSSVILGATVCIEHLAVLYYVLVGYKKPHGNLLRYVMLLFALTLGIDLVVFATEYSTFYLALSVVYLILIPYIAGRLNKIDKNKVLIPLLLVLFIIDSASFCISANTQTFVECFRSFGVAIEWLAISAAYVVRYKEHKEAGLADAPKVK